MSEIGLSFDAVADVYDRVRPRYPAELYDDVAALTGAPPDASVLEVGCGSGQATRGLLARGWHVHAVEPGPAMAARARANLDAGFTVDVTRFEDWDPAGRTFDLLFSATAYHWVAPEVRWKKAAAVLRPGASIVLATNRTVAGATFDDVYRASADLHARYAPEIDFGLPVSAASILAEVTASAHDIGTLWAEAETKAGPSDAGELFTPPGIRSYEWTVDYDAADGAALLATYSMYLRVPPERRAKLLDGIADIIRTDLGGTVTRRYLAVLAVAERVDPEQDRRV
ncbi:class I SAM-dependent methyltransferase [Actinophytocola oryzae]|uniref:Methyltransferase family protein n=1 Tax=Actinophytocola oryzae TaxID=502181 RepID=A0A4R7VQN8_9PSEU|nr:class I SAM-dependent methyltransferase [Actinophytocola oryzae]TDV51942.1 methyltransferase family protein [Actinophytocola oryzae]